MRHRRNTSTRTGKFRSVLESSIVESAKDRGLSLEYEPKDGCLGYMLSYIPDFRLPNGILVEAKGYFPSEDRTKMLRVKRANPEVDIRFIFMADNVIRKGSKLRYSDWCKKHGFKYHIGRYIPEEWWYETTEKRIN